MLLPLPLKTAASSNLLVNRLEEVAAFKKKLPLPLIYLLILEEAAVFRGSGSWIPEVAACTLLTRYRRENFKIATFSRLSGICKVEKI